jgi:hypothetical protein
VKGASGVAVLRPQFNEPALHQVLQHGKRFVVPYRKDKGDPSACLGDWIKVPV